MAHHVHLPESISGKQFMGLLARYEPLIQSIQSSKSVKPGQKTLLELDRFRYDDAPARFTSNPLQEPMTHGDVQLLVEWKLRHGKFRPTLMKLVKENDAAIVKETIQNAVLAYRDGQDASKTLGLISKLRGIGPATASLLLSVHDPEHTIFFSDEVFYWLCCDGRISPLAYNAKEYRQLDAAAQRLAQKLQVRALDIEKVAYVVMREGPSQPTSVGREPQDISPASSRRDRAGSPVPATKRKRAAAGGTTTADTNNQPSLRRSKRGKAT